MKKLLKTLLVFSISTIAIYMIFTLNFFNKRCKEYQFSLFSKKYYDLRNVDREKIKELGDGISNYAKLLEESHKESDYIENSNYHAIAEDFDPLGYSVWSVFQTEITMITNKYICISILLGVSIGIAYVVITSKKMNNIFKILIGYFLPMLIIPPIYAYNLTYRSWDIFTIYRTVPKYFYIIFTLIFIIIYIINYVIGLRITKKLNETVKH